MSDIEVCYIDACKITLNEQKITQLIEQSEQSKRGRSRFCLHSTPNDILHEMIIAMKKNVYVRPHRHINKVESFMILKGEMDVILFDENGNIESVIPLGTLQSGKCFYYKIEDSRYHMVIIRTKHCAFVETTLGPFEPGKSQNAPWAPTDENQAEANEYLNKLLQKLDME